MKVISHTDKGGLMTFPRRIRLCILVVYAMGLWGCTHEGGIKSFFFEPTDEALTTESGLTPQTLEASPQNSPTESSTPELVATLPATEAPKTADLASQQAVASSDRPTNSQPTRSTSTQLAGKVFGEYSGVKTKWEQMKNQLADQLKEQEEKTNALKVKLQLIEQIAEHVDFTTKAYVTRQNVFLAEFTIENRTPYAIKDISIACDQIAPTMAIIQSHTETIYAIIKPTTRSTYAPIPFGTKH